MKKITFLILLFSGLNNGAVAQELSYGALLGYNAYDIEINGPISAVNGDSGINIGGFVDYQLNSSFGVRGSLIYSSFHENTYSIKEGYSSFPYFDEANLKTLQVHALLRYDVNREYNKGFYLTGGFRMTNVLSAKIDGVKDDTFYKKANFGVMLGFGVNFAKHFGIELIPEVNLTNTLDSTDNKARNYGFYTNLTVNLESIFKR